MRVVRRPCPPHGAWPDEVPEILRRIYAARGVSSAAEAELGLSRMLPPDGLGQLDRAVRLLADAMARDRHIVVVGDFDCDGATGTAVAVRGLRLLGAPRLLLRRSSAAGRRCSCRDPVRCATPFAARRH